MTSPPSPLTFFVEGALCAGYALTALFFLRFWARTRDRFFALFSVSFVLMAANQAAAAAFTATPHGEDERAYILRLLAFVIIIFAVLDKNRVNGDSAPR